MGFSVYIAQFLESWNSFIKTPILKAIYFSTTWKTNVFTVFLMIIDSKGVQYTKSKFHRAIFIKQIEAISPGLHRHDIMKFSELFIINTSSKVLNA